MEELQKIFTEMLDHIDDHRKAYDKPQWTNEAIVKVWIKTKESELKNLFIYGVSNCADLKPTHLLQKKMSIKRERAKYLKELGYSIRDIMKIMGYKSPKSIQDLLKT